MDFRTKVYGDSVDLQIEQLDSQFISHMNITYSGVYTRNLKVYLPGFMRKSIPSILSLGGENIGIPYIHAHDDTSEVCGRAIAAEYVDTSALYRHIPGIAELNELDDFDAPKALQIIQKGLRGIQTIYDDARLVHLYTGLGHVRVTTQLDDPSLADEIEKRKIYSISSRYSAKFYCPKCGTMYESEPLWYPACPKCKKKSGEIIDGYAVYPFPTLMDFEEYSDVTIPAITLAHIVDIIRVPVSRPSNGVTFCEGEYCMKFNSKEDLQRYLGEKGYEADATALDPYVGKELEDKFVTDEVFKPFPEVDALVMNGSWEAMLAQAEKDKIVISDELKQNVGKAAKGEGEWKRPFLFQKAFPILDGEKVLVELANKVLSHTRPGDVRDNAILQINAFRDCEDCGDPDPVKQKIAQLTDDPKIQDVLVEVIDHLVEERIKPISGELDQTKQKLAIRDEQIRLSNELVRQQTDMIKTLGKRLEKETPDPTKIIPDKAAARNAVIDALRQRAQ